MAKRSASNAGAAPAITPSQAIPLLEEQLDRLKGILATRPIDKHAYMAWEIVVRELLTKSFGPASETTGQVFYADWAGLQAGLGPDAEVEIEASRAERISNQLALLEGCIKRLKLDARIQAGPPQVAKAVRESVLDEVFTLFWSEGALYSYGDFEVKNREKEKIDAFDSLFEDGTLSLDSEGRITFALSRYVRSQFWDRDEALINQVLPVLEEMYIENRNGLHEILELATQLKQRDITEVGPKDLQRIVRLLAKMGLVGFYNLEPAEGIKKIKNFQISSMILRSKTVADQIQHYLKSAATISSAITVLPGGAHSAVVLALRRKAEVLDLASVTRDFDRALSKAVDDPEGALTAACSTLESVCKCLLEDLAVPLPNNKDVTNLVQAVQRVLKLAPEQKDIDQDLRRILGGLTTVAGGIGALRTHGGDAHGRGKDVVPIDTSFVRLAIHAASTLSVFLIGTWERNHGNG